MTTAKPSQSKDSNNNPKPNLRALLVEDSPLDATLIARSLQHNYRVYSSRVDTATAMEEALKAERWDVVLCDYSIPGFGVIPAMELLKKHDLDLPFIVVSGTIGEDVAVEAVKSGAHDYIMKDKLVRLPSAIEREMRQAQARQERARTLRNVAWLASIVDSMGEAVAGIDLDGRITSWNAEAELLYGRKANEALGLPLENSVPAPFHQQARQLLTTIEHGEKVFEFDTVRLCKGESQVDISAVVSTVKDESGQVIGAALLAHDITERKKAEEERKKMIKELNETIAQVRRLHGLLPICASCKKIRDEKGAWQPIEKYISGHSDAEFSHSICPGCAQNLYSDYLGKG